MFWHPWLKSSIKFPECNPFRNLFILVLFYGWLSGILKMKRWDSKYRGLTVWPLTLIRGQRRIVRYQDSATLSILIISLWSVLRLSTRYYPTFLLSQFLSLVEWRSDHNLNILETWQDSDFDNVSKKKCFNPTNSYSKRWSPRMVPVSLVFCIRYITRRPPTSWLVESKHCLWNTHYTTTRCPRTGNPSYSQPTRWSIGDRR